MELKMEFEKLRQANVSSRIIFKDTLNWSFHQTITKDKLTSVVKLSQTWNSATTLVNYKYILYR